MATPVLAFANLANELEKDGLNSKNAERLGAELAKTFGVKEDEVAVLHVVGPTLKFLYPLKLAQIGSLPINPTSSVAARTASNKRAEIINNFAQAKHASVFEAVELGKAAGDKHDHTQHVIQKLMSVPVVTPAGVVGVVQISKKGANGPSAGADFTPADLQKLVGIAGSIAKCFK